MTTTFDPGTRVRPTVPLIAPDHEGAVVTWKPVWVLRVMSQVGGEVKCVHDVTGRRCVLPADKLTRVGG